MSLSDDEEIFGFYGKPLEQFDEDEIPKKRPISVEEQIATDTQGRRRFHGAFTGGFSAGFFNTVGSLEGWKPSEFRSSRNEKSDNKLHKPEDYMDDEDFSEFGIAPQRVKATKDFNTSRKRKKQVFTDGPIPGEPVLHTLIEGGNETVGYLLLRNMGYKQESEKEQEQHKVYGCEMPMQREVTKTFEDICVIPEMYMNALKTPKINTFGVGYVGLNKDDSVLKKSSKFVIQDMNKKKLSISGQAFGVGAFEDEDDDIYVKEDLSKYDFELTAEKQSIKNKSTRNVVLDIFIPYNKNVINEKFNPPTIPQSFSGIHKVKKSRFDDLPPEASSTNKKKMDAEVRSNIINNSSERVAIVKDVETEKLDKRNDTSVSKFKIDDFINDKFTKAQTIDDNAIETEKLDKLNDTSVSKFQIDDFINDKFTKAQTIDDNAICNIGITYVSTDVIEAAKMKMFGKLTRVSLDWYPNSTVCKRFNVPDSMCSDTLNVSSTQKPKFRIFEEESFSEESHILTPGLNIVSNNTNVTDTEDIVTKVMEKETHQLQITDKKEINADSMEHKEEESLIGKELQDLTSKIDVSKNTDLFKAVFLDSDSEDDNTEFDNEALNENELINRHDQLKSEVLSSSFGLPTVVPLNIGILSNINDINVNNDETKNTKNEEILEENEEPSLYGPKLPTNIEFSSFEIRDANDDEWVEKKESKNEKKRKKHHKHKHKHKRKN